jgi:hypothetical protein
MSRREDRRKDGKQERKDGMGGRIKEGRGRFRGMAKGVHCKMMTGAPLCSAVMFIT